MQVQSEPFILSAVTSNELKLLQRDRLHTSIKHSYGLLLRSERLCQKMFIWELQSRLKENQIDRSIATISRWEVNLCHPDISQIEIWARCLNLKMSVFLTCEDRRLIGDYWHDKLTYARQDGNLAQKDVSKAVGIYVWTLRQWERGKKYPTEQELRSWAIAVGCEAELVFERQSSNAT